jgi:hypothetical protein
MKCSSAAVRKNRSRKHETSKARKANERLGFCIAFAFSYFRDFAKVFWVLQPWNAGLAEKIRMAQGRLMRRVFHFFSGHGACDASV